MGDATPQYLDTSFGVVDGEVATTEAGLALFTGFNAPTKMENGSLTAGCAFTPADASVLNAPVEYDAVTIHYATCE